MRGEHLLFCFPVPVLKFFAFRQLRQPGDADAPAKFGALLALTTDGIVEAACLARGKPVGGKASETDVLEEHKILKTQHGRCEKPIN